MASVNELVSKLKGITFNSKVRVTIDVIHDVSGVVEGHSITVATRAIDPIEDPYDQFRREIEEDLRILEHRHPDYTSYHIRMYSLSGNYARYGKLVLK